MSDKEFNHARLIAIGPDGKEVKQSDNPISSQAELDWVYDSFNRLQPKTLHLNLKRKWFDMIYSGVKLEEYREIKPAMVSLLYNWRNNFDNREIAVKFFKSVGSSDFNHRKLGAGLFSTGFNQKYKMDVDTITFSNGYAKDRDQFVVDFKGLEIRAGNPEWGAVAGEVYFVLKLGKVYTRSSVVNTHGPVL